MNHTESEASCPTLSSPQAEAPPDNESILAEHAPSILGFFPTSTQRSLPPEVRDLVYNAVASHDRREQRYSRLLEPCHWMYYRNNLDALNLIRSGNLWDMDAISAPEVYRATKTFTLLTHWHTFLMPFGPSVGIDWLLDVLKGIDLVYASDLEHQSASSSSRKWAAPLPDWIMQHGTDYLWATACSNFFCPRGEPMRGLYDRTDRVFLQTAILQLRRKPEVTVRIFVHSMENEPVVIESDAALIERSLKRLLAAIAEGMTMTRLPRRTGDAIRYKIILVSKSDQIEFWKERLGSVKDQVKWDLADNDEEQFWKCV